MADIPVVVIFGATASGKTALLKSLFASSAFSLPEAEVVSADSCQVYKGMDIGTAKPPASLLKALPHHLINIRKPNEPFCAGDFVREADRCCAEIHTRGHLPIVSGGTGFYIKNFVYGLPKTPQSSPKTREALKKRMEAEGLSSLYAELAQVDPARAAAVSPNDAYRILRALEVYADSGLPQTSFLVPQEKRRGYRFLILSLDRPRDELYKRIDERCRQMLAAGLEKEAASLVQAGFSPQDPGMRAIGYREFFSFPGCLKKLKDGDALAKEEADTIMQKIAKNSRLYAKRQETFIKPMEDVIHVEMGGDGGEDVARLSVAQKIKEFCRRAE